ncbi:response regulator transcription factor [Zunongwangia profunda]|uniref:Two-component response regulator n=3 Tax=Zunongwangia profunda TaxID=398743 RepID=D5BBT1_ZUNPS|nr:response regulator transcription factor [Zunongwangia profunda]ADF52530.1 two-component response regulator [Zunongwangia profunda SM-A87]MAG88534.1 DNA-binding response regulator [Flavobacteriaceae bacterium]MAS70916.1 DNA-binding response regulator [Zunongwangia sp.]HCV83007.1 DNA-binding response regulator [Zunongwangia profunda]|tara:strand:- start:2733 stop:3377 length:645 start_codon:yes stop_codon:yes gene_type:complete
MKTVYNIIIADDHKMFVDGLRSILEQEDDLHILHTTSTGEEVLKYLKINQNEQIDLLITDLNMPGMDGIALNKNIKKDFPGIKTLVISMLEDGAKIKSLTEDEVNGYLSKNAEQKELLKAIRQILLGENYFSTHIQSILIQSLTNSRKASEIRLTQREKEVLQLIAKEHTTQEIADMLFLSKHTIESYRKNLINKLEVRNLAGLTRYAIEHNMV